MTRRPCHFELFPHDADVGVRGFGSTLEEAFEQAAVAMTAAITDPAKIVDQDRLDFDCAAPDHDLLLIDWLNALVYAMSDRNMLFGRFEVHIDDHRLHGSAWGEPVDRRRHEPAVEVKGATMTSLDVSRGPDGIWQAQCVIDV
jgi:tRNA nucleotidyltransferase (CCA-adding enzyme)